MGTEVAKKNEGQLAILSSLKTKVQKSKAQAPSVGQMDFLRMLKSGKWVFGQNNMRVQEGSLWAVDPLSFKSGFVCWTDYPDSAKRKNKMLNKVMLPLGSDLPAEEDLKSFFDDADEYNNGEPWPYAANMSVELTCISGEDKSKTVLYETSSKGGIGLIGKDGWLGKMEQMIDEGTPVAVIRLTSDSYIHDQWGETMTPDFDYVEWRALDDTSPIGGDEAPPEAEPQQEATGAPEAVVVATEEEEIERIKEARREAAAEQPDDGGDAPQPTRRRRRPAA